MTPTGLPGWSGRGPPWRRQVRRGSCPRSPSGSPSSSVRRGRSPGSTTGCQPTPDARRRAPPAPAAANFRTPWAGRRRGWVGAEPANRHGTRKFPQIGIDVLVHGADQQRRLPELTGIVVEGCAIDPVGYTGQRGENAGDQANTSAWRPRIDQNAATAGKTVIIVGASPRPMARRNTHTGFPPRR